MRDSQSDIATRPLPFFLAAEIPYDLDVLEFRNKNIHPVTKVIREDRPHQSKSRNGYDAYSTHYRAHIIIGSQAPVLGKTKFIDLTSSEQNLIIGHEMLHVLITYHPYLIATTQRLDALDLAESNMISDIVIDYCAILFRRNYLFGAMTGFKNMILFHNKTFIGLAKNTVDFLATATRDPVDYRFLYLQQQLLEKMSVLQPHPLLLQKLSTGTQWSPDILAAHDQLCDDLISFGDWVKKEKYDFLSDPELVTDTEFIEFLRVILEKFIDAVEPSFRQAQQQAAQDGQKRPQPSQDHTHTSFPADKGVNDTKRVDEMTLADEISRIDQEGDPDLKTSQISTESLNPSLLKKQAQQLARNGTFGIDPSGRDGVRELYAEKIDHNTLLGAKREVTQLMGEAMRIAMQDPTGVQGSSLVDGVDGSFHFNVTGAIQAVQQQQHPTLFRAIETTSIKRKTILSIFDVSSSMDTFNRALKPWMAAFLISNLHVYFTVKVVEFSNSIVQDRLPYDQAALSIINEGSTDPFAFGAKTNIRLETWRKLLHDIRPDAIIFVSDMEYGDAHWSSSIVYDFTKQELHDKAQKYLQERFKGLGFSGTVYPIICDTQRYTKNTIKETKENARKVLKEIINDPTIRY